MSIYIGVDGGGSKTHVMLLHAAKGAMMIAPSSNPNAVGVSVARGVVTDAIARCLDSVGAKPTQVDGVSVCMAGVGRPEEAKVLCSHFQAQYPNAAVEVTNDALAALTAGTEGGPGVVLVAGTGSIAVGETTDGTVLRAGGFGYLLGDEGSGFAIGRSGLMAAIQGCEGRGPATSLWAAARETYGVAHPSELIRMVYQADRPVTTIARFAKPVLNAVETDEVAGRIVDAAIVDLQRLVASVLTQDPTLARVAVLSGGLLTGSDTMVSRLQSGDPTVRYIRLTNSGAAGAVLRAMRLACRRTGASFPDAVDVWRKAMKTWYGAMERG